MCSESHYVCILMATSHFGSNTVQSSYDYIAGSGGPEGQSSTIPLSHFFHGRKRLLESPNRKEQFLTSWINVTKKLEGVAVAGSAEHAQTGGGGWVGGWALLWEGSAQVGLDCVRC